MGKSARKNELVLFYRKVLPPVPIIESKSSGSNPMEWNEWDVEIQCKQDWSTFMDSVISSDVISSVDRIFICSVAVSVPKSLITIC